jgi:diphthamide synthase (EF-2-diphthine--ammonia ligase)
VNRIAVAWSGGKDSAWALRSVPSASHLICTFDESTSVVPIHNTPLADISRQAEALRMPLIKVPLPSHCPNTIYIERFAAACAQFDAIVFGDLFLDDIRQFRIRSFPDKQLLFPLWNRNTGELAREMIRSGLIATVTVAQNPSFVGQPFDEAFLERLPPTADPCGENGEFHTYVNPACLASFR